ncbi:MAG: PIN domain-containing protein [Sphingomonas sp.]|nr:PIN domain-containing protein [Sphingomonas sp.]
MSTLIDTNIAIHLRDSDSWAVERYRTLAESPALSIVSIVELEGGIVGRPDLAQARRASLDLLTARLEILDFDGRAASAYRDIIAIAGYSRSKLLDRMIAATAIVHQRVLITANGADFRDIPGLRLEIWAP